MCLLQHTTFSLIQRLIGFVMYLKSEKIIEIIIGGILMKYSACIELLFSEVEFIERFKAAKKQGFDAVEFWLWEQKDIQSIKKICNENNIKVGIFQGNTEGRMIDPKDKNKYIAGVKESLKTASELSCPHLFLMTDILREDRTVEPPPYNISDVDKEKNVIDIITELAPIAEKANVTLVIEPLNIYVDHAGYYLNHSEDGFKLIQKINNKNVRLLYDIYHMQIMEGNIISTLVRYIDLIGYIHVADVPGRHEPGTGELNFANIYRRLVDLGYKDYIGFEFIPTKTTKESLKYAKKIFNF